MTLDFSLLACYNAAMVLLNERWHLFTFLLRVYVRLSKWVTRKSFSTITVQLPPHECSLRFLDYQHVKTGHVLLCNIGSKHTG